MASNEKSKCMLGHWHKILDEVWDVWLRNEELLWSRVGAGSR